MSKCQACGRALPSECRCTIDGFSPDYWEFCQEQGIDPTSVASVARYNVRLRAD